MVKLSDHDIDDIMKGLDFWTTYITNEGFRGKAKDEEIRKNFREYLRRGQSGLRENVCHHCLGTGYNETK